MILLPARRNASRYCVQATNTCSMYRTIATRKITATSDPVIWMTHGRYINKEEKAIMDPAVTKSIESIVKSCSIGNETLTSFSNLLRKYPGILHMWKIFGLTKEKLVDSLSFSNVSFAIGNRFFRDMLHHLRILKRLSPLWKEETKHKELFDAAEAFFLKNVDKYDTKKLAAYLSIMADINFQTHNIMKVLTPRILNAPDFNLRNATALLHVISKTTIAKEASIKEKCMHFLDSRAAYEENNPF